MAALQSVQLVAEPPQQCLGPAGLGLALCGTECGCHRSSGVFVTGWQGWAGLAALPGHSTGTSQGKSSGANAVNTAELPQLS